MAEKIDPRVRRTRKLLEDAMRALLIERPFAEISVADIADRATVNRATFYAHYEDKAHLASSMIREDLHQTLLSRLAPPVPFNVDSLAEVIAGVFEFVAQTLSHCAKHAAEFSATVVDALESFLRRWFEIDSSAIRTFAGASAATVTTVLAWAIYGAAQNWSHQSPRRPLNAAAREVAGLLMRG